mmetsp:Transcript_13745/g.43416  ORF Transcript_13745/g.43416 Transcript_13745/m.43416 type:complete len:151 (+) Transcript_13745:34-486(+)
MSSSSLTATRLSRRLLATAKKNKKVTKADKRQQRVGEETKDAAYEFYRSIVDSPKGRRPKFTAEEYEKHFEIGHEYNRQMRKRHDRFNASLQLKIDIQQFALNSLPPDLRAHADSLDDCPPPPLDRRWWTWTPPIPGFNPNEYVETETFS